MVVIAVIIVTSVALLSGGGKKRAISAHVRAQNALNATAVQHGCKKSPTATANTLTWSKAPAMSINTHTTYYAHVLSDVGPFVIALDPKRAPIAVNSFVFLARHNFYNCVSFHRVISSFVIQGGDPTGTGTGGPGYKFKDELPKAGHPTYPLYSVAMANSGANTNGSQFFIITGTDGEGLPANYSLFGQVVSGISVVRQIADDGKRGPLSSNSGVPPYLIHRMMSVTISTTK